MVSLTTASSAIIGTLDLHQDGVGHVSARPTSSGDAVLRTEMSVSMRVFVAVQADPRRTPGSR
jgi:hypothetical protein